MPDSLPLRLAVLPGKDMDGVLSAHPFQPKTARGIAIGLSAILHVDSLKQHGDKKWEI